MPAPVITAVGGNVWNNTASPTVSVTTGATDFILLLLVYNEHTGSAAATVSSVTSAGMTWALRKRSNGSATGGLELWWAHGTGPLSSYSVTINMNGAHDDACASICAVTGCASNTAPFDTNAGLPAALSAPTVTWTPSFTGINTNQANDLLLFLSGSVSPTGAWTPPTSYTNTDRHTFGGGSWSCMNSVDSRQVTTLQSNITVTSGTALSNAFSGTATCGEVIFDALTGDVASAAAARAIIMA